MAMMMLGLLLASIVWCAEGQLTRKVRTVHERDASFCIVNGRRIRVGESFQLPQTGRCIHLVCDWSGRVSPVRTECDEGTVCRPLGYIRRERCLEQRCERRGDVVAFHTYREDCNYKGRCHPMGTPWFDSEDCQTMICRKKTMWDGRLMYSIERTELQCKDAYGHCRRPGERFTYNFKGYLRNNCYCHTGADTIQYTCPAV